MLSKDNGCFRMRILVWGLFIFSLYVGWEIHADVAVKITDAQVQIGQDSAPIVEYRYAQVPFKPYIAALFTPCGKNVLRDAPPDHLHHHGLMYAVAVDQVDFWQEAVSPGRQVNRGISSLPDKTAPCLAAFVQQIDWLKPDSEEVLLKEQRTIRLLESGSTTCTLLSWESAFSIPKGREKVTLSGSHYFGLGLRFAEGLEKVGSFINAADDTGELVRGDERLVRAAWCAYQVKSDRGAVTIAGFSSPTNLRSPAIWFTMAKPFAYLSATLNLWKEPYVLNTPLVLRYGIGAWDGAVDREEIERIYQRWLKYGGE